MILLIIENNNWNSFLINIISGIIIFILGIIVAQFNQKRVNKRNKRFIITKLDIILRELCDYISDSPFRDKLLNNERIAIFTKKKDIANYRFVALCTINVFNKLVYPQMTIVIYNLLMNKNPNETYKIISVENSRLKTFRSEIERIITVHSLQMDNSIILKISNLCFDIKKFETAFKSNIVYNELLESTGSERNGVFGINDLPKIYDNLLVLIRELISLEFFEYKIELTEND